MEGLRQILKRGDVPVEPIALLADESGVVVAIDPPEEQAARSGTAGAR